MSHSIDIYGPFFDGLHLPCGIVSDDVTNPDYVASEAAWRVAEAIVAAHVVSHQEWRGQRTTSAMVAMSTLRSTICGVLGLDFKYVEIVLGSGRDTPELIGELLDAAGGRPEDL